MNATPHVIDHLREHAARHPGRTALATRRGAALTYRQLADGVSALTRRLAAGGHGTGGRLGLCFAEEDGTGFATGYLAALASGATAVVLPGDADARALRRLSDDVGLTATLAAGDASPLGTVADLPHVAAGPPDDAPAGGPWPDPPDVPGGPDVPGDVLFTTGSTGRPKPVAASRGHLDRLAAAYRSRPAGPEVLACGFSPSSALGTRVALLYAIARGIPLVTCVPFDAAAFLRLADRHRAASALLPAAAAHALLRALDADGAPRPTSLRRLRFGADHLSPAVHRDLAAALPWCEVLNVYGLTEAGDAHLIVRAEDCHLGPGGRPGPGTRVRVLADDGSWAAPGVGGALCLRGPLDPMSYLGNRPLTASTWRDGWTVTHDRGWLDEDGRVHLDGRDTSVARIGGRSVSTADVRRALESHPGVAAAAVVPVPHPTLGQTLAAVVERAGPAGADGLAELGDFLRGSLPAHAVPSVIFPVAQIPLARTGKPDPAAIRKLVHRTPTPVSRPCQTAAEKLVATVWSSVLRLDAPIGPDDNFIQLGGDSMTAVQVLTRLEEELGDEIPPEVVVTARTLGELAQGLEGRGR